MLPTRSVHTIEFKWGFTYPLSIQRGYWYKVLISNRYDLYLIVRTDRFCILLTLNAFVIFNKYKITLYHVLFKRLISFEFLCCFLQGLDFFIAVSFHAFYLHLPYVLAQSTPFLFFFISSRITEDIQLQVSVPVTKITENSLSPS